MISDRFWRRRFLADTHVIGKQLRLDKNSYTVVGVMPGSFLFPDHETDILTPSPPDAPYAQARESTWFIAVGRLKAGVALAQARADLANVQAQLGRQFPHTDASITADIHPLKETTVGSVGRSLWVLFASVSVLLLIACTNISALLLARTTGREREISVRFSLGASRSSIVAQLLTECLVLAAIGSALSLFVASDISRVLRLLGRGLPRVEEISLDWRIVLYTTACALFTTFLCGLFPAIRGTRRSIAGELSHASRTQVSTRNPLQWMLVGIQVTLAVTLLIGAGLLLRSFQAIGRVSPGFETSHILTFRISGDWGETTDQAKLAGRINNTLDGLRKLPGVRAAATSSNLPGIVADVRTELRLMESRPETGKLFADSRVVSSGYFATMNIPILEGEGCRNSGDAFTAAAVNRSFANKYFTGTPTIGHHLQLVSTQYAAEPVDIRGVVGDAREQGLNQELGPTVYWCASAPGPTPFFLIQTSGEPLSMADTLRRTIHRTDPARSVFDISPLEQHLSDSFAENRMRTVLLTLFAMTALLLVCVGLYATLSYFVTLRKREIGLRLALGAVPSQIIGEFLSKGLAVSSLGFIAGLVLAGVLSRGLSGMLYGVSSFDFETYAFVLLFIGVVATASSMIPSIRAARVEPMQVLRDE